MGMAASQARYLALVARKSNCEYEGQQINQSRLALSNQSAELFNQMMTLEVPSPPSKTDYTYKQYSYTDGAKTYTIDKWNQLSDAESDGYNYVVTYHYNSSEFTGYQKYKLNPQVQFSSGVPTGSYPDQIDQIEQALLNITNCQNAYDEAMANYKTLLSQASNKSYYKDASFNGLTSGSVTDLPGNQGYRVAQSGGESRDYYAYDYLDDANKAVVRDAIDTLVEFGALDEGYSYENMYYDAGSGTMVFRTSIDDVASGVSSILYTYYPTYNGTGNVHGISNVKDEIDAAKTTMQTCLSALDIAKASYEALNVPKYVGNATLTPLSELTDDQAADIVQIIKNMHEQEIETNITKCFNTTDGTYNAKTYIGGLYTFDQAGETYYATFYDLANSAANGSGINNIDNQVKLPYYGASSIDTPKTVTERAVVETDSSGRFTSIRFENDSIVYALKTETATDEVAYEDAMNQYNYERSLYDKKVSDINAKTSIIQRQDQNLELRLKQLDTEQNALSTEIDAVAKVVKDNVEKSFKTFGG